VRYLVISHCETVGSGDMQSDSQSETLFRNQKQAISHFAKRIKVVQSLAANEIFTIDSSKGLIFDAPIIAWTLMLRIHVQHDRVRETLNWLKSVLADCEDPYLEISDIVLKYEGFIYSPQKRKFPMPDAIEQLVDYLR
jgi:hypothetical protein